MSEDIPKAGEALYSKQTCYRQILKAFQMTGQFKFRTERFELLGCLSIVPQSCRQKINFCEPIIPTAWPCVPKLIAGCFLLFCHLFFTLYDFPGLIFLFLFDKSYLNNSELLIRTILPIMLMATPNVGVLNLSINHENKDISPKIIAYICHVSWVIILLSVYL